MRRSIRTLLAFWISGFAISLTGCQNRAPSLRMLDARAGYDDPIAESEIGIYGRDPHSPDSVIRRSAPREAKVHIFGHELPNKDYFLRGDIMLRVSDDEWVFEDPTLSSVPRHSKFGVREIKKVAKASRRNKQQTPKGPPTVQDPEAVQTESSAGERKQFLGTAAGK